MTSLNIEKYADRLENNCYASALWKALVSILDPEQATKFEMEFGKHIPLKAMVSYTQEKFLRKVNQHWALESETVFESKTSHFNG